MTLVYDGCSRTGQVREHNEDAMLLCAENEAALFLVADGIGGKESGEVVSGMLRDAYALWWQKNIAFIRGGDKFSWALEEIRSVLLQVNREVVLRFGERKAGSTLALLFLCGGVCACLSSGDSRVYRSRGVSAPQITRDDTSDNLSGGADVPSGKLIGAVGIRARLDFSVRTDLVRPGDAFFLCTDGVYHFVPEQQLKKWLVLGKWVLSPGKVIEKISADVEQHGARDNYTMIFVKVP